jgi:hypothetical protein
MWFGSLSSVMNSAVMTSEPLFYEIETPHTHLNTMDVSLYSMWVYLVNWPELERFELDMYFKAMPMDGPKKGFVWHSLRNDAARYVEEPGFLARFYRAHLWFNDPVWSRKGLGYALPAGKGVVLAGIKLTVRVEPGWTRVMISGQPAQGRVALDRPAREYSVQFLR